jgi:diguanylate cyclase (GGDEF)-like protein
MIQDGVRGVLNVNNKETRQPFGDGDLKLIEAIASHAGIALQNAERFEDLLQRAQRCSLTGLANHGHFWSCLAVELQRASRYQRELSVVMVDVDRFKSFNDGHGHTGGDEALIHVARLIEETCRSSDLAARYGGDEFALILPETSRAGAVAFGEKIRQSVEAASFGRGGSERITISVGASAYPEDGGSERSLVEAADAQLYRAKSQGRNQVCSEER